MNIRTKVAAGILSAGIAVTGLGSAAWADTTVPPATKTPVVATAKGCKNAEHRIDRLQHLRTALETRLDRLQKARQEAIDHHNAKRVKMLEARIDKVNKRLEVVKDRIQRIKEHCDLAAPVQK